MPDKVFISSTQVDLSRHRAAVRDALLENGFFPVEMEEFGARDVDPESGCLRLVAQSQLFVGIYAWRYGYVPPGADCSITAEELAQARRLGKPRFYFLVDERYPWPADPAVPAENAEAAERLRALKESLSRERLVAKEGFGSPEQLALQVITALNNWQRAKDQPPQRPLPLIDLLDKVERAWVECGLNRWLPKSGLLMRDREERLGDIAQPSQAPSWAEPGVAGLLPTRTLVDLFVERGQRLLILGEGGSGKTIDLLQLARSLLELARDDPAQPVPVVLKLGSWRRRSRSLDDWMAREVGTWHKLDLALVRGWIAGDLLLPLLDGLDEVEADCQDSCAHAINEFLAAHPKCRLAVTCRRDVNDELAEHLDLRCAYALRPLSAAVLDRLAAGADTAALRAALLEPGWRELAQTPLFLMMMERVLEGDGTEALVAAPVLPPAPTDAAGGGRRVLDVYIEKMLASGPTERPPGEPAARPPILPPARSRRCLAWLAGQMRLRRMALFQLDDLQPSWLEGPAQLWIYAIVSRALGGALLLLPVAVLWPAPFLVAVGGAAGAAAGLLDGWRLRTRVAAAGTACPLDERPAARAVVIGAAAMAFFISFAALSRHEDIRAWRWHLPDVLRYGLFIGALFGLAFGRPRGGREGGDTAVTAGLSRTRWSWSKSRSGAAWPPLLVTLWWLIEWLRWLLTGDAEVASWPGLGFCALVAVVTSAVGGLVGGLLGDIEEEPAATGRRRRGLRPALDAAVRGGGRVVVGTAAAFLAVVLAVFQAPRANLEQWGEQWRALALAALTLGLWSALGLRGLDLIQHLLLRLLLAAAGAFPLRWVRFLDQAVARNLMHRVGQGYQFIHPLLAEELAAAQPDPRASRASEVVEAKAVTARRSG